MPEKVRVSLGSAIVLDLIQGKLDAAPTTVYLLTYIADKCSANCGFCPQARMSKSRIDLLSRVTWPQFLTKLVISKIGQTFKKGKIIRVCIQSLNYPEAFEDILDLAAQISSQTKVPLSISCQPLSKEQMEKLVEVGADRIGIPLDAATGELFDEIKGSSVGSPYRWEKQRRALVEAVEIFGKGHVSTHLIVGLGETEREVVETLQWCFDSGVHPGLFAFTPVHGTALEKRSQPSIGRYRRVQIAHYLIGKGSTRYENMVFEDEGDIVDFGTPHEQIHDIIETGTPFATSGCPGCNRPYYNEKPSGPIYNYPQKPQPEEIIKIKRQIYST